MPRGVTLLFSRPASCSASALLCAGICLLSYHVVHVVPALMSNTWCSLSTDCVQACLQMFCTDYLSNLPTFP